jgi:hypothetical protein
VELQYYNKNIQIMIAVCILYLVFSIHITTHLLTFFLT